MAHGDDKGLRLPPKLAPIQIVILPVRAEDGIITACKTIAENLEKVGYRTKLDGEEGQTIGWKINKWELRGVPLRIEIGNKEIEAGVMTIVRRDTNEKMQIRIDDAVEKIGETLEHIQKNLLSQAEALLKNSTHEVTEWEDFEKRMEGERGFLKSFWCGRSECETRIKEQTKATTRCLAEEGGKGKCIFCGEEALEKWYFAQAY